MSRPLRRAVTSPVNLSLLAFFWLQTPRLTADEHVLRHFDRQQLTDVYYSEGIAAGDLDRDGIPDVVHGPYWFRGPALTEKREIYPARPQPRERYADNFFSWVYDVNGDGWNDVFTVGFPGKPASVYENPGAQSPGAGLEAFDRLWERHEVFASVSNESPHFTQLVGDDRPELVCTTDGYFGYATIDESHPFEPWRFHRISGQTAPKPFGHGLGVGDVNGDGRLDVLMKDGWFEQPESLGAEADEASEGLWAFHPVPFAPRGGAEMHVYDVDGDGDPDVLTSLAAHEFGLAWWEQQSVAGAAPSAGQAAETGRWRRHLIMGETREENRYGVLFSELHTVGLADVDGDGLKDIVTGKTYWSHHTQSPMWDAGAVVYWFRLVRSADGVDWVPYRADGESGVGRQLVAADLNADGQVDLLAGGMKGAHVLRQRVEAVSREQWEQAQPRRIQPLQAGLTPAEAAAHMTVPAGFRVTLAAAEPDVHQPIAFTLDERGRLWVAEAFNYPQRAPEGQGRDQILILEDTDGDGTLDSRKVFAEGLNLVSGLEVGFGGVWVGAAPHLLFLPDRDRDDRPDGAPQVLLDGWGDQDTHETLNSFIWGPDGWLYGCHGVFTHSLVGPPGAPPEARTPLNAGVWRYHPVRHEFEVFAHGSSNPWGVDFNDYGEAFITACVIPHLYHVIPGGRYQRQAGQHFDPYTYDDLKTIAVHRHYAGDIRAHAWWGQEPEVPQSTLDAGGGHAHCGAMVYLGDNWPESYRNQIFMHNIHGNRINQDVLAPTGSGYVGNRAPDVLLANDKWFRGISLKYGPDGGVWLIDWYDRNACHRRDPEIWDRTNGRVYKVTYGAEPDTDRPAPSVHLAGLSDLELAELHEHRNDWYVRSARRLLQERAAGADVDPAAIAHLSRMLDNHQDVSRRLRALWTLHTVRGIDDTTTQRLLADSDPHVRAWSIRLAVEDRQVPPAVLKTFAERAHHDPSAVVRLALAAALQRLPASERWEIAAGLVGHAEDAEDHNLPLMIWYGVEPLVAAAPDRALALVEGAPMSLVERHALRRASTSPQALEAVVAQLLEADTEARQSLILSEMLQAFRGRANLRQPANWGTAYAWLSQNAAEGVREQADQVAVLLGDQRVFPRLRAVLADRQMERNRRRAALDTLVSGRDAGAVPVMHQLLEDVSLRGPAIRALAMFDDPATPGLLLSRYAALPEADRRDVISTLCTRVSYARPLLEALEAGRVPRTELHAYNIAQLLKFDDESLQARIQQVWGAIRETSADRRAQIDSLKGALSPNALARADRGNGRRLFDKNCATCHRLFGEGQLVGPDLTGSNRADLDYILSNVVDPSAVLGKDYRQTVLVTSNGQVVSGLLMDENDSAVTIRTINDTVVVPKADIEERSLSDLSMMPERLLDPLPGDEIRDLVAYLSSPAQVPLSGPKAPIAVQSGRVPDALEGESLTVLRKTAGNPRNQSMAGFSADRWSGADHLWWTGAAPGARLELEIPVATAGRFQPEVVMTKARDYGIVQLTLDGQPLGGPIDLFNFPDVITTGVLTFPPRDFSAGQHVLTVEIVGAHERATKSYLFGLDYIRLSPASGD